MGQRTPFRHVAERAVAENRCVQRGEKVVRVGDHRAEVFFDQLGVVENRFRERAEQDAQPGQLLAEGSGYRDAIEDRVHPDSSEQGLLLERDAEPFVGCGAAPGYVGQVLGLSARGFWRGVVDDALVVDGRVAHIGPLGSSILSHWR